MASWFEDTFSEVAAPFLRDLLYSDATYYPVDNGVAGASFAIRVIFNEQVGFIDNRQRAVWNMVRDDLQTAGVTVARGHYFILSGETLRWTIVDLRDDKAGLIEVRADAAIVRN